MIDGPTEAAQSRQRRSIRLAGYDYAQAGAYFVTICTYRRQCFLGRIVDGETELTHEGQIVASVWTQIRCHYPHVRPDTFVIMPNHLHGILIIGDSVGAGSPRPNACAEGAETAPLQRPTLGQIVAYFKYQAAKRINTHRRTPGVPVWQRNYYEHVIRNADEMNRAREYIVNNSLRWALDCENPNRNA